jgi:translation initiation factor 6
MIKLSSYDGNPYIGVYCVANEHLSFVPNDAPESLIRDIEGALGVKAMKIAVAGSRIIGSLMSMNSDHAVITSMATEEDMEMLSEHLSVLRIADRVNAAGNNILLNDNAALINPEMSSASVKQMADILGIECIKGSVAGYHTVGSVCKVTNKGIICHPKTGEDELRDLQELFRVPASVATLNFGSPMVGASLVANSHGAVVGDRSTPIELGRLEDGLALF